MDKTENILSPFSKERQLLQTCSTTRLIRNLSKMWTDLKGKNLLSGQIISFTNNPYAKEADILLSELFPSEVVYSLK